MEQPIELLPQQKHMILRLKSLAANGERVSHSVVKRNGLSKVCALWFGTVKNALLYADVYVPYTGPGATPDYDAKPDASLLRAEWKKISSVHLKALLKELLKDEGRYVSAEEAAKLLRVSLKALIKPKSSWSLLLNECGFVEYSEIAATHEAACKEEQLRSRRKPKKYSEEDLKAAVLEVHARLGGVPSSSAYREIGSIPLATVSSRFGSWTAALKACGLTPVPTVFGRKTQSDTASRQRGRERKREKLRALGLANSGEGSQTQAFIVRLLAETLESVGLPGEFEVEKRLPWLKNPLTNAGLRLDAYFSEVNMAVEYQSQLHFSTRVQLFDIDLEDVLFRDYTKRQLLQEHGVTLLEIAYFEPHTLEYLSKKLTPLLNQLRENYSASQTRGTQKAA